MSSTTAAANGTTAAANTQATNTSSNAVVIRSLEPDDCPQVCDLWVAGLQQTRDAVAHRWIVGRLLWILMDRLAIQATSPEGHVGPQGSNLFNFWKGQTDREMYVAVDADNKIVGSVGVKRGIKEDTVDADSKYASVWMVSVSESSRRSGIGVKLMQQAEQWALEQEGCSTMRLVTANPIARVFYERLGYCMSESIMSVATALEKPLY